MGGNGKNKCGTLVGWCVWYLVIGWLSIWTTSKNWANGFLTFTLFEINDFGKNLPFKMCVGQTPMAKCGDGT